MKQLTKDLQKFLQKLPKTSIATILGALIAYCQSKGYIGSDEAVLISAFLVATGLSINLLTKKQPNDTLSTREKAKGTMR